MVCNLDVNDFIVEELEKIMNEEKDKNHAPKRSKKEGGKHDEK